MKKIIFAALAGSLLLSTPVTAFAGTWKQDDMGWWYENDDGSYITDAWFMDTDGKWYCFDVNGYMITNTITPEGYKIGANGACSNPYGLAKEVYPEKSYENKIEDTLPFIYGGELVETPCVIYYDNYRKGKYTTVKYESAYMQEWNGKSTSLVINYSVEKTGGYSGTYFGCSVYVNGKKLTYLGGKDGNEKIWFNQNVTSVFIPTDTFVPGDLIDLRING